MKSRPNLTHNLLSLVVYDRSCRNGHRFAMVSTRASVGTRSITVEENSGTGVPAGLVMATSVMSPYTTRVASFPKPVKIRW
jgi:hypothetical protein